MTGTGASGEIRLQSPSQILVEDGVAQDEHAASGEIRHQKPRSIRRTVKHRGFPEHQS